MPGLGFRVYLVPQLRYSQAAGHSQDRKLQATSFEDTVKCDLYTSIPDLNQDNGELDDLISKSKPLWK